MTERVINQDNTGREVRAFKFNQGMLHLDGHTPSYLRAYRQRAWEAYTDLPMPSPRDEAWRRTDLRALDIEGFQLPSREMRSSPVPKALLRPLASKPHAGQVILSANGVKASLAPELVSQGVIFTDLGTAEKAYGSVLERVLGQVVHPEEGKFSALAAALAQTGVIVYVPRHVHVEQPLHSIWWGTAAAEAYLTHNILWLEEGASLTYIHEAASSTLTHGQSLHSGLMEVYVGEGASLRFVELQSWGDHVWNFSHERVRVQRDGNLDWIFGAIGSRLTKNFTSLDLVAPGAVGRMSGFYFTDGNQHLDHDTQQNHLAPHTTSDLLFKGALKGKSRSVWQGMVYVAPNAQKADGYQANRNLILSPHARADSIPGLEIMANDVRCSHGATVSKVDAEQLFFLQSRGIPSLEAERLIVEGFFDPIMQRIPFVGVRTRFQRAIQQKMNAA